MFNNRSLQLKMVKDQNVIDHSQPIDYEALAKLVTKSVVICIVSYVGADTLRRFAVYAMTTKY
jgi:hypothetical protein